MWIITAWQRILPEVTMKGFKKCCISNAMDETDDNMLWNGNESIGILGVSVRNMMMLTVKMDRVTLIGKGR